MHNTLTYTLIPWLPDQLHPPRVAAGQSAPPEVVHDLDAEAEEQGGQGCHAARASSPDEDVQLHRVQGWVLSWTLTAKSHASPTLALTPTGRADTKVVYRRYASLFFVMGIGSSDNELVALEIIHRYVELLDKYFGNVCASLPSDLSRVCSELLLTRSQQVCELDL